MKTPESSIEVALDAREKGIPAFQILDDLKGEIESYYGVRYLVIDCETEQLESRTFFETTQEAESWAKKMNLESYRIGEMIVPVI